MAVRSGQHGPVTGSVAAITGLGHTTRRSHDILCMTMLVVSGLPVVAACSLF